MAKRRKDISMSGSIRTGSKGKPVQRCAANARERARMRVLSKAFSRLKTTLPWVPADTKLSKLDTLRLASSYISHLREILEIEPSEDFRIAEPISVKDTVPSPPHHHHPNVHPLNLTWPFTFHSKQAVLSSGVCNKTIYSNDEFNCDADNATDDNFLSSSPEEFISDDQHQMFKDHRKKLANVSHSDYHQYQHFYPSISHC